jgi:hypothetical protein
VLKLLRESTGNILDDEVLIATLNTSKATSATIVIRVREAEDTERAINAAREVRVCFMRLVPPVRFTTKRGAFNAAPNPH